MAGFLSRLGIYSLNRHFPYDLTDRNFDFTTICNDYTPEAGQIKMLFHVGVPEKYLQKEEILKRPMQSSEV
jgi:hypothetical protein